MEWSKSDYGDLRCQCRHGMPDGWGHECYPELPIVRLFGPGGTMGADPTPGGSMAPTGNTTPAKSAPAKAETTDAGNPDGTLAKATPDTAPAVANQANPTGKTGVSTGDVGDPTVIHGQEHVLGDDPRRIAASLGGFHDSLSGRQVDKDGNFTDGTGGDGPIPKHRIVANDWPTGREKLDDPNKRQGNDAPSE